VPPFRSRSEVDDMMMDAANQEDMSGVADHTGEGQEDPNTTPQVNRSRPESVFSSIKKAVHDRFSAQPASEDREGSATSLGSAKIEKARRVELKRIRHRRLAEELRREAATGSASASALPRTSGSTFDAVMLPPPPNMAGGGPRDTLEFSFPVPRTSSADKVESSRRSHMFPVPGGAGSRGNQGSSSAINGGRSEMGNVVSKSTQLMRTNGSSVPGIYLTPPGVQDNHTEAPAISGAMPPASVSTPPLSGRTRDAARNLYAHHRTSNASEDNGSIYRTWLLTQMPGSPLAESPRSSTIQPRVCANQAPGRSLAAPMSSHRIETQATFGPVVPSIDLGQRGVDLARRNTPVNFRNPFEKAADPQRPSGPSHRQTVPAPNVRANIASKPPRVVSLQMMNISRQLATESVRNSWASDANVRSNRNSLTNVPPSAGVSRGAIEVSPTNRLSRLPGQDGIQCERIDEHLIEAPPNAPSDGGSSRYSGDGGNADLSRVGSVAQGGNLAHGRGIFEDHEQFSFRCE
jgi:hypothetical protein